MPQALNYNSFSHVSASFLRIWPMFGWSRPFLTATHDWQVSLPCSINSFHTHLWHCARSSCTLLLTVPSELGMTAIAALETGELEGLTHHWGRSSEMISRWMCSLTEKQQLMMAECVAPQHPEQATLKICRTSRTSLTPNIYIKGPKSAYHRGIYTTHGVNLCAHQPPVDELLKKMWHMFMVEYCPRIENTSMSFTGKWMNYWIKYVRFRKTSEGLGRGSVGKVFATQTRTRVWFQTPMWGT